MTDEEFNKLFKEEFGADLSQDKGIPYGEVVPGEEASSKDDTFVPVIETFSTDEDKEEKEKEKEIIPPPVIPSTSKPLSEPSSLVEPPPVVPPPVVPPPSAESQPQRTESLISPNIADSVAEQYSVTSINPSLQEIKKFIREGDTGTPYTENQLVEKFAKSQIRLPLPTENMYDDLTYEQASALQNLYYASPHTTRKLTPTSPIMREPIYVDPRDTKNQIRIPIPSEDLLSGEVGSGILPIDIMGVGSAIRLIQDGVISVPLREAATFVNAGADKLVSQITGEETTYFSDQARSLPRINTVNAVDNVLNQGSAMLSSGALGSAALTSMGTALKLPQFATGLGNFVRETLRSPKALKVSPTVLRPFELAAEYTGVAGQNLLNVLKFEVPAMLGTSSEADTILTGDKALIPLMEGVKVSPDDPEYDKILFRRFNGLVDTVVVGTSASKLIEGITVLTKAFLYATVGAPVAIFSALYNKGASKAELEALSMKEFIDGVIKLDSKMKATPEEFQAAAKDLLEISKDLTGKIDLDIGIDGVQNFNPEYDIATKIIKKINNDQLNMEDYAFEVGSFVEFLNKAVRKGPNEYPKITEAQTNAIRQTEEIFNQAATSTGTNKFRDIKPDSSVSEPIEDILADPIASTKPEVVELSPLDLVTLTRPSPEGNLAGEAANVTIFRETIQDMGESQLKVLSMKIKSAEKSLEALGNEVQKGLRESNSELFRQVRELEQDFAKTSNINRGVAESGPELANTIGQISMKRLAIKNNLFNKVQGGEIDVEQIVRILSNIEDSTKGDAFIRLASGTGNSYYDKLIKEVTAKKIPIPNTNKNRLETFDEIVDRVQEFVDDPNVQLDFAKLFTSVRPSLSRNISLLDQGLSSAGKTKMTDENQLVKEKLIQFRDYIDSEDAGGAIDYLRENGEDEVIQAANTAMSYFKNQFARFFDPKRPANAGSSPLAQIHVLYRDNTARGIAGGVTEEKMIDHISTILIEGVASGKVNLAEDLVKLLKKDAKSTKSVAKYMAGLMMQKAADKVITTGTLGIKTRADLIQQITPFKNILEKSFKQESKELDDIIRFLQDTDERNILFSKAKEKAEKDVASFIEELSKSKLSKFYNTGAIRDKLLDKGFKIARNEDGYSIMNKILDDTSSVDRNLKFLSELARLGDGVDSSVRLGMQSAFLKWSKDKVFTVSEAFTKGKSGTETVSIMSQVAAKNIERETKKGADKIIPYAEVLFADNPAVVNAFRTMLDESIFFQKVRKLTTTPTQSSTNYFKNKERRFDAAVTQVFGPLDRFAARFRAGTKSLLADFDYKKAEILKNQMTDELLTDPERFVEVLSRMVRKEDNRLIRKKLRKYYLRAGVYTDTKEDQQEFDEVLDSGNLFYGVNLTPVDVPFTDGTLSVPSLDQQTSEVLSTPIIEGKEFIRQLPSTLDEYTPDFLK